MLAAGQLCSNESFATMGDSLITCRTLCYTVIFCLTRPFPGVNPGKDGSTKINLWKYMEQPGQPFCAQPPTASKH